MMTSLNRTKQIDDYLLNRFDIGDELVFQAMLILDTGLKSDVMWHRRTRYFIQQYSRKKLKAEIELVHRQLFSEPVHRRFRNRILNLFK